jgi:hypothetical protein
VPPSLDATRPTPAGPETPAAARRVRDWFDTAYVRNYAEPDGDGSLPPLLELKRTHTHRVAANARRIATDLGWDEAATALAELAGLLHDLGRFPQYRQYRTFRDHQSADHARLSWEAVQSHRLLAELPPATVASLETAVRGHNRRQIPADTPAAHRPLLALIRDADKLDIFFVVAEAIHNDRRLLYPDVDTTSPPSPAVIAACRRRETVPYRQIRSLADSLVLQLLWLHDINFTPTIRLMLARGVVERIGANLPDFPEKQELLDSTLAEARRRAATQAAKPAPA